jgi:hypothetical protein
LDDHIVCEQKWFLFAIFACAGHQTAIVNSLEQSALQSCVRNLEIASEMYDEVTAFQRALPEMTKYDRYERRALSRRLRAIRTFVALQLIAAFGKTNPTLNS